MPYSSDILQNSMVVYHLSSCFTRSQFAIWSKFMIFSILTYWDLQYLWQYAICSILFWHAISQTSKVLARMRNFTFSTIYPPVLRDLNSQFGRNSWFFRFWHTGTCNISGNMQYAVFYFYRLLVRPLRYLHVCVTLRFRPFILLFYAFSIRNLVENHVNL